MAQFVWYDCTFNKQCTAPVPLTFDLWKSMFFQWIDNDPIKCPSWISDRYLYE